MILSKEYFINHQFDIIPIVSLIFLSWTHNINNTYYYILILLSLIILIFIVTGLVVFCINKCDTHDGMSGMFTIIQMLVFVVG